MPGVCDRSGFDGRLHHRWNIQPRANQMAVWNVDGAIRGFDLARNPGLSNNTEYGAGEFPLPIRPSVRSTGQSTSKIPSMSRAQQTGEAYPDLSIMKRELERTQRERNKANLDRDTSTGIRKIRKADTTGTIGWTGARRRETGEIASMRRLGWNTSRSHVCLRGRST